MKTTISMRLALIIAIWRGRVVRTTYDYGDDHSRLTVELVPKKEFMRRWNGDKP